MSDTIKTIEERSIDASSAYLERTGSMVLDRNFKAGRSKASLIALDGDDLVVVEVKSRRSTKRAAEDKPMTKARMNSLVKVGEKFIEEKELAADLNIRVDGIHLLIIAEDRALLRHHRSVAYKGCAGSE